MRWWLSSLFLMMVYTASAQQQSFYELDSLFKGFPYMQIALQEQPQSQHRKDSACFKGALHFDYCEEALYLMLEDLLLDGDSTATLREVRKKLEHSIRATGSTFLLEFEQLDLHWCARLEGYRSGAVRLQTLMGYDCHDLNLKLQLLLRFHPESQEANLEVCIIHLRKRYWYFMQYSQSAIRGRSNREGFNSYFDRCQRGTVRTSDGTRIDFGDLKAEEVQDFWLRWNGICE